MVGAVVGDDDDGDVEPAVKVVSLAVSETVSYEQAFEVDDDFDVEDAEALEELWCSEQDLSCAFLSVDERDITAKVVGK